MTLENGLVQPAFGYYVGHPSVIKARVDGRTVTAHIAVWSVDKSVTVFWSTADGVAEWGYDTIQGFLHSRPVTAAHIDQPLADRDQPAQPPAAPIIADDAARSAHTRRYLAATAGADPVLKHVTTLAATALNASYAFVTLIDGDRQTFLANHGLDIATMPRDQSFCTHTITTPNLLIVPDATTDPRFANHPVVNNQLHARFYAGAPLITDTGHTIGTLCIFHTEPRTATATQLSILRTLADMTMHHLQNQLDDRLTPHQPTQLDEAGLSIRPGHDGYGQRRVKPSGASLIMPLFLTR